VARHSNIKDPQLGPEYFSQFSIVLNALDNLEARRHVNRICIAKDITLVESGTQGYIGQVSGLVFVSPWF
jgi:ubiquitin-like 1-activating enzyme E1 B